MIDRFSDGWDRHVQVGPYHVRMMNRWGPCRANVEVWKDVWPAVGGLMGRRRFWNQAEAVAFFEATVEDFEKSAH